MSTSDAKSLPAVGFLTVGEFSELGLIGGYLVLNTNGRPLEFHCTAPVRANRAQEILYGPTLEPFLFGEQIGQALMTNAKRSPLFVCTDVPQVLALRDHVAVPVVHVSLLDGAESEERHIRCHRGHQPPGGQSATFQLAGHLAAVASCHAADEQVITSEWSRHGGDLDLVEPFTRLSEAILETQSGRRSSSNSSAAQPKSSGA